MLALAALPLFGFVGAAIDFSRAASVRTSMQGTLDATALMMAKNAQNMDANQLAAQASTYFNANFQNSEAEGIETTANASSTSAGYTATLSAAGSVKTRIMEVVGFSALRVAVHSTATAFSDGLGCVLSLSPHESGTIAAQGSAITTLNGCSLYDNSDNSVALTVGGSAQLTALSVGVVGNLSGVANITTTAGIRTGIAPLADPYADVSIPSFGGCSQQNFTAKNTVTIEPGVYCGGISVNAGATLTLSQGIYYLDGGNLQVNGGGTLNGDRVTLVFTSKNRSDFATASINGNATVNLTPPTTGPTAGIVMFGDRRIPAGTAFKFNGGATQYLGGAIYVPTGAVSFSGGSGTSTSCTQLIGYSVTFTGNSAFALNCNNYGTRPFSPLIVKLAS
jgi:Flp pilus assembly protein TadG